MSTIFGHLLWTVHCTMYFTYVKLFVLYHSCRRTWFNSLVGKIPWRRDRLPTPVFLAFPGGSAGKESALQCGIPGFDPWVGKIPWRRERLLTPVFWPRPFHGLYSSVSSIQSLSHVQLFAIPWTAACQASLSITNSESLLKLMSIEYVMPSKHLILCHPFFLLPSIFPSIRVSSNESVLSIRWLKYWSFSFSISPSNEHPGLISFRMDWLDLLAVQGTLKSLLQHHSSKASIPQRSAFFIVQLSHPYMTTGKTIALTR